MSYDHYKEVKTRGPSSAFLLKDNGIKVLPVCLNVRKFKHQNENNFVQLNISFEILFDIENYFSIGYDFYSFSHHQSHLTNKSFIPTFNIRHEPLYEYGNEECYLPKVDMIAVFQNEQQVLDYVRESISYYEEEEKIQLWPSYLKSWNNLKRIVGKKTIKNIENSPLLDYIAWDNLFNLFKQYENYSLIKGKQ